MAQTAEIHQFPDQGREAPRGPQVEDGYTRIANELYEVVNNSHAFPVTLTQLRIVHAVIRRTYGFNKTMDALADTQIAADTGIPRQKVNPAKHALIAMKVLVLSEDGRKIGINKAYGQWDFSARPEKKAPQRKAQPDGDTVTKKVTQSVTKSGTHKRQKDTLPTDVGRDAPKPQKRLDVTEFANQVAIETLHAFAEHRRVIRSPLTQHALKLTVDAAGKAAAELGITAEQALEEAIEAGWRTVRVDWLRNRGIGRPAAIAAGAPACPHAEILKIWDETCASDKGKAPNLLDWKGTRSADALEERWAEFFNVEVNGKIRYDSLESGIEWWRMALTKIASMQDFRQSDAKIWDLFYKGRFSKAANGNLCKQMGAVR